MIDNANRSGKEVAKTLSMNHLWSERPRKPRQGKSSSYLIKQPKPLGENLRSGRESAMDDRYSKQFLLFRRPRGTVLVVCIWCRDKRAASQPLITHRGTHGSLNYFTCPRYGTLLYSWRLLSARNILSFEHLVRSCMLPTGLQDASRETLPIGWRVDFRRNLSGIPQRRTLDRFPLWTGCSKRINVWLALLLSSSCRRRPERYGTSLQIWNVKDL